MLLQAEASGMGPRLFISAGEVSGDLYGAGLLEALRQHWPDLQAYGLGGPWLQAAGLHLLADVRSRAAVGLSENLAGLPFFWRLKARLQAWLRQMRPDAVILVDFQGLNLQLAGLAKALGIPVIYFVAPQDWLWGLAAGTRRIVRDVDLILAIFAPEAEYYQLAGAQVVRVGHPLLSALPRMSREQARQSLGLAPEQPIVCWMPGSRRHELRRLLPVMTRIQTHLPQGLKHLMPLAADFLAPSAELGWAQLLTADQRYAAMLAADVVIGASGNMVLEAALLARPVVAMYQVSPLTYAVARRLVPLPWITLPNILLQREVVPEFVQTLAPAAIAARLQAERDKPDKWAAVAQALRECLAPAEAYARAAAAIADYLAHRRAAN